jgi:ABC-2 type transport system permease protein
VSAARTALANSLKALARGLSPRSTWEAAGALSVVGAALALVLAEYAGLAFLLQLSERGFAELPSLVPSILLERLLVGAFSGTAVLLLLGSLTTAVSTLFLSEELVCRMTLPVSHARLLLRQMAVTVALASGPAILLVLPAVVLAARHAPSGPVGAGSLAAAFLFVALLAGTLGSALALGVVALFPPKRARLLAAFLSTAGLAAALLGVRGAQPERFLDPAAALDLLLRLGTSPVAAPGGNPLALAAHAATRGLAGETSGLVLALALVASALGLLFALSAVLAPLHLKLLRRSREESPASAGRRNTRLATSETVELVRAETRTLLRDVSTPAQLGTLAAVFVLDLLNLRLLPSGDAASRDVVHGLQAGLGLFLVSALSLRFAYPAVSTDGRAALLLRTLPHSPVRHLLARWAVRAVPSLLAALLLSIASAAVLQATGFALAAAIAAAAVGGLAIPALQLGLGALFPRYDAPNPVSVALGPGGLFAMALSTVLGVVPILFVSEGLRSLLETLLGLRLDARLLLAAWCAAATVLAAGAMAAAARRLPSADLPAS